MKLAALGVVTAGLGVALAVPGLTWIGVFWVVMGLLARRHARKLKDLGALSPEGVSTATEAARRGRVVDGRTFALGTLLWVVLGVPSLAVGVFEIGIGAGHEGWRWLPITVGALALGIGGVSAAMYLAGSAALAVTARGHKREFPAIVWMRAVRETGTYVNERPRLEFDLLVEPEAGSGLASYEVTKKATVPFSAIASLRVGNGFKALVAGPEDPASMDIHWDEPVTESGQAEAVHPGSAPTLGVSSRLDELDRLYRDAKISEEEYNVQRQRILGSL